MISYYRPFRLESMVSRQENILWRGKPNKKCFILESIFNPMLPFATIWALFDSIFIVQGIKQGGEILIIISAFMLVHLMPVWIYLAGIIFAWKKYDNTEYMITDRGIYISGGIFTFDCKMKTFFEISHINIHRGMIDQSLFVGDVVIYSKNEYYSSRSKNTNKFEICDIEEFEDVFMLIKDKLDNRNTKEI